MYLSRSLSLALSLARYEPQPGPGEGTAVPRRDAAAEQDRAHLGHLLPVQHQAQDAIHRDQTPLRFTRDRHHPQRPRGLRGSRRPQRSAHRAAGVSQRPLPRRLRRRHRPLPQGNPLHDAGEEVAKSGGEGRRAVLSQVRWTVFLVVGVVFFLCKIILIVKTVFITCARISFVCLRLNTLFSETSTEVHISPLFYLISST
ncbi:glutaredoxin 3 [Strigomonas culicis]|uniref:Glutaredoxin 3 n=1 Tax=Strigomonas culicis TaxID=28005 RepID=S9WC72_9TRYP|nr:glutaredoxin 3 [Strigomonas culicis]|eukprot:EPY33600.1 glutaredoxin 3 [Strigomonas culicis]